MDLPAPPSPGATPQQSLAGQPPLPRPLPELLAVKGETTAGCGQRGRRASDGHWGKTPGGVSAEAGRPVGCGLWGFLGAPGECEAAWGPEGTLGLAASGPGCTPGRPRSLPQAPEPVPRRKRLERRGWGGPAGPARPGEAGRRAQPLWIRKEEGPWVSRPDRPQGKSSPRAGLPARTTTTAQSRGQRRLRLQTLSGGGWAPRPGRHGRAKARPAFLSVSAGSRPHKTKEADCERAQGPQMRFSQKVGDAQSFASQSGHEVIRAQPISSVRWLSPVRRLQRPGLQHARLPCRSPSHGACSDPCPLSP